jgi:4'-phosphopantetheinyl transferase
LGFIDGLAVSSSFYSRLKNEIDTEMKFSLKNNEVNIYFLNLKKNLKKIYSSKNFLSQTEQKRADRFKFEQHKNTFIISRTILRKILGELINALPEKLIVSENRFGKPFLENYNHSDLKFNISHSGDFVVYAVCLDSEIGIDIERIDPLLNHMEIAQKYFTLDEISYITTSLDTDKIAEKFYRIWTRKEALLKSIGTGLLPNLNEMNVLKEGISVALEPSMRKSEIISITDIAIHKDYGSAIAHTGKIKQLNFQEIVI